MSKRWIWGGVAVLVGVLAVGVFVVDRATSGIASFLVWRALSPDAQSGRSVHVNEVDIYFETYGEGEPLLLAHGGLATIESMHEQITRFSGERRVIVPERREHGRSSAVEGPLTYADMADDMIALLDFLKIERTDIFGWSDGGIVALDMAMRFPERVGKIAIFGSNYHFDGVEDTLGDSLSDPASEEIAPMRVMYEAVSPNPDRWPEFFEKITTMWRTEPQYTESQLATIDAPTLVMVGEFDAVLPEHTESLARAIPDSQLEILPGATHFAPLDDADRVNDLLSSFLNK